MGGVGRLACQGFLFREACVGVVVRGPRFLLCGEEMECTLWSAMECPVICFELGLCVRCDHGQPVC